VELIKDYNRFLSTKQPQNLGLHEIDKMISGGVELLNFIQARNDKIDEDDINGQPLDEFDVALYGLPAEEDFDIDKLEEKDLPAGINLDGEPLSKSELRELEKLENKSDDRRDRDKKRSRSPRNKRDRSRDRSRDRDRRDRDRDRERDRSDNRKQKKYSKHYSSSSSSRSKSDSRSRSRSKSPGRKGSKKDQRRR